VDKGWIAVTGATGYVGARLVGKLLEEGYRVKALGRSLEKLQSRYWAEHPNVALCQMDVFDEASCHAALKGCTVAYYFIHSMNPDQKDFAEEDRQAAQRFVAAAEAMGLNRIIYLGGLGKEPEGSETLSKHLQSRREVENLLQAGNIPVTVFRAAMIIGSGSASFEILRYLSERLPIMITPKWVQTLNQPIGIRNVLHYLTACLTVNQTVGQTFDIGGPDVVSYQALIETYRRESGLNPAWIIPVPVFSITLSSYWIHLITPVSAAIARPLAQGLKNEVIVEDNRIQALIPQEMLSVQESIKLALQRTQEGTILSHWTDAGYIPEPEQAYPGDPNWSGGSVFIDKRRITLTAEKAALWKQVVKIGGATGWYYGNWLWALRGIMDIIFGGIGLRKGRRHADDLHVGDALDCWRVVRLKKESLLTLIAEMKVPGKAVLSFEITETLQPGQCELTQTAVFRPKGLLGLAYWYAVTPLHAFVFDGMLKGIVKAGGFKVHKGPVKLCNDLLLQ
jgi:uncharacterized protein YbjT (DUF2867 family)